MRRGRSKAVAPSRAYVGAAEGISESIGAPLPPFLRSFAGPYLLGVRDAVGNEQFAAAWTEGRQMTPDAVVAYVLRDEV